LKAESSDITRALLVFTNHQNYPTKAHKTGLWLSEATHFMEAMERKKIVMDFVSPLGGVVPIDDKSLDLKDATNRHYYEDSAFQAKLNNTLKPAEVKPENYQIIYFTGGHGTMWDFPENEQLQHITRQIYEDGGMVAAVCHGVAGLLNVKLSDGAYLVAGKRLTGFSNWEERLIGLKDEVPFLLQDELKKRGAEYHKAMLPFLRYIKIDERLVTGQNPQSARKVGNKVIEEMFDK
jgi:putative intracellular protease/amidase